MEDFNSNNEEKNLYVSSEADTYFNNDCYKEFIHKINKYPKLTGEENKKLAILAQNGDLEAREKLINCNLRLVVYVAFKYKDIIKHLQIMDIIQEGVVGLFEAIEKYDPERGAFSSCAVIWIKRNIRLAISNSDREIRIPTHTQNIIKEYKKIIDQYVKLGRSEPNDEILCDLLNVSLKRLEEIKLAVNTNVVSIDQKLPNNDDTNTKLDNFITAEDDDYEKILKNLMTENLFVVLKEILTPLEYFVIYYRYLIDKPKTLENIGSEIGITRETVRILESKAFVKIKPYLEKNNGIYEEITNELLRGIKLEFYNSKPITSQNIALYLFMINVLNKYESEILYYELFGKYKLNYYREFFGYTEEEFAQIKKDVTKKTRDVIQNNTEEFKLFYKELKLKYKSKIFKLLKGLNNIIDYEALHDFYDQIPYTFISSIFEEDICLLSDLEKSLLIKYFNNNGVFKEVSKETIEKEIYLLVFGQHFKNYIKLKIFLNNKSSFTDEEFLFMECYYFCFKSSDDFTQKYPKSPLTNDPFDLISRLDVLYSEKENEFILNEKNMSGLDDLDEITKNEDIIFNVIKKHHPDFFDLDEVEYHKVLKILKDYGNKMKEDIKKYLMAVFEIKERDLMSKREINEVFRIIDKLEKNYEVRKGKKLKRTKK